MSREKADLQGLLVEYRDAAAAHGAATEQGDHEASSRACDAIAEVYGELRRRGTATVQRLIPFLEDEDVGVRFWVASHALEFAPEKGQAVLSEIAQTPNSLIAFSAKMALREWKAGRLKFP